MAAVNPASRRKTDGEVTGAQAGTAGVLGLTNGPNCYDWQLILKPMTVYTCGGDLHLGDFLG